MNSSGLRDRHPSIALMFKDINAIIRRDKKYINEQLTWRYNPAVISLNNMGLTNKNKIVLDIHEQGKGCGFFAEYRAVLSYLLYADCMGFKPIVHWGKDFLYYDCSRSEENAFLYYFEPIGDYCELKKEKNVAECKPRMVQWVFMQYHSTEFCYELCDDYVYALAEIAKKYIRIKPLLEDKMREAFKMLTRKNKGRILGVHYRGTDYNKEYRNHPKIVSLEQYIQEIRYAIENAGFSCVFCATDQDGVVDYFSDNLNIPVLYYKDVYRADGDDSVAFSESDRDKHKYWLGFEVLRDMLSLSWCDGLISGLSQVPMFSRITAASNGKEYDYIKVIDNGINHDGKNFVAKGV